MCSCMYMTHVMQCVCHVSSGYFTDVKMASHTQMDNRFSRVKVSLSLSLSLSLLVSLSPSLTFSLVLSLPPSLSLFLSCLFVLVAMGSSHVPPSQQCVFSQLQPVHPGRMCVCGWSSLNAGNPGGFTLFEGSSPSSSKSCYTVPPTEPAFSRHFHNGAPCISNGLSMMYIECVWADEDISLAV